MYLRGIKKEGSARSETVFVEFEGGNWRVQRKQYGVARHVKDTHTFAGWLINGRGRLGECNALKRALASIAESRDVLVFGRTEWWRERAMARFEVATTLLWGV